jgi:hypothetical protein
VNLTEDQYRVLAALRGAAALRREPGTLTPDGHHHWHSPAELADEGRLPPDPDSYTGLCPAVLAAFKALRRAGLVAARTQYTVTRFRLEPDGFAALRAYEDARGLTEIARAELDLRQAHEDRWQAWRRVEKAQMRLAGLQLKAGARP